MIMHLLIILIHKAVLGMSTRKNKRIFVVIEK